MFQTDFAFEFPRLIPPNVKLVGPILPEPATFPLEQDEELSNIIAQVL